MLAHTRLPDARFPTADRLETFYTSTQTRGRVSSITNLLVTNLEKLNGVQNFITNADVLRRLRIFHGTYACMQGFGYHQVVRLLASNLTLRREDSSKNMFKEEDLLTSISFSTSARCHSNTATRVDTKPVHTQVPIASVVHLLLRVAPCKCAVTVEKLLRSSARKVHQIDFLYLDKKVWLRRDMQPWQAKRSLYFQVVEINGTVSSNFGRTKLLVACDLHTKFILHILGRQVEVAKLATCSRNVLSRLCSAQVPQYAVSTAQLRPRDISVLDNIYGVETSAVSFDELELTKKLLNRQRSMVGIFHESPPLCRPQQILVYDAVDELTEQKILADNFQLNASVANMYDAKTSLQLERIFHSHLIGCSTIQARPHFLQTSLRPRFVISFKAKRVSLRMQQPFTCSIDNFLASQFTVLSKTSNERGQNEHTLLFWHRVHVHKILGARRTEKSDGKTHSLSANSKVCWEDIGGHAIVKRVLKDIFSLARRSQELQMNPGTKRNVLLFGPPGTGKTLIAKVVAAEISAYFMDVKGPELLNMYVGESERAIRTIFREAEERQPCLLFFDEMDSIAPDRSHSSSMLARMASQIILEFDCSRSLSSVFIMGASNRPDMLDRGLLRPGRFDYLLYTGIGNSIHYRENLLRAATRRMSLSKEVDLREVASLCAPTSSGADIYGVCVQAWIRAARRTLSTHHDCILQAYLHPEICVKNEDIVACAVNMTASVCVQDICRYDKLYQQYDCTCMSSSCL